MGIGHPFNSDGVVVTGGEPVSPLALPQEITIEDLVAFIASRVPAGSPGQPGAIGQSAYEIAVALGFEGTEAEWIATLKGADGDDGTPGAPGQSAYALAVALGYAGTEAEWIDSLHGADGLPGVLEAIAPLFLVDGVLTIDESAFWQAIADLTDIINSHEDRFGGSQQNIGTGVWTFLQQLLLTSTSLAVTSPHLSRSGDTNSGVHFPGADQLALVTGGTAGLTVTNTGITIPSTRPLTVATLIANALRLSTDYVRDAIGPYQVYAGFNAAATSCQIVDVNGEGAYAPAGYLPRAGVFDRGGPKEEYVVVYAQNSYNATTGRVTIQLERGKPIGGGVGKSHLAGENFEWCDNYNVMHGYVLSHLAPTVMTFGSNNTLDGHGTVDIYLPPRGSWGQWPAPASGYVGGFSVKEGINKTVRLLEPTLQKVIGEIPAGKRGLILAHYNSQVLDYFPLSIGAA